MLNGTARFSLKDQDGRTVFAGTARANATYQRDEQRFASVRAARDADIRVAKLLADDIRQRLAAHFASAR
jgi:LPS-assembly lipoprotein